MKLSFTAQIGIAMGSAILVGLGCSHLGWSSYTTSLLSPVGTIFLNLIKFIVCPLVLFSVIDGISSMKDIRKVGIFGLKTVVFFLVTTMLSIAVALFIATLCKGIFPQISTAELHFQEQTINNTFANVLIQIFPSNFIEPFLHANMLQVIVMATIFAIAVLSCRDHTEWLITAIRAINQMFVKSLEVIMKISPLGIFCLMCPVIATNGATILGSLAIVLGVTYVCYIFNIIVIDSFSVKIFTGRSPLEFLKKMTPAMVFAFSSSSSVGTLPVNMNCAKSLGVPDEISSFVLPLGATINMNGTAIYHGVCAVFIASCYGIQMTAGQITAVIITSTLSAIGTAGVPGAGVIMLAMVLSAAGLPLDGIALVAGVDRLFDMGRTVSNITGDTACAVCLSPKQLTIDN